VVEVLSEKGARWLPGEVVQQPPRSAERPNFWSRDATWPLRDERYHPGGDADRDHQVRESQCGVIFVALVEHPERVPEQVDYGDEAEYHERARPEAADIVRVAEHRRYGVEHEMESEPPSYRDCGDHCEVHDKILDRI
jgi:hypothetical protein